jgi:hypothetical protein
METLKEQLNKRLRIWKKHNKNYVVFLEDEYDKIIKKVV